MQRVALCYQPGLPVPTRRFAWSSFSGEKLCDSRFFFFGFVAPSSECLLAEKRGVAGASVVTSDDARVVTRLKKPSGSPGGARDPGKAGCGFLRCQTVLRRVIVSVLIPPRFLPVSSAGGRNETTHFLLLFFPSSSPLSVMERC